MCTAQGLIGIARIEQIRWGRGIKRVAGLDRHPAQASERQLTERTDIQACIVQASHQIIQHMRVRRLDSKFQ